VGPPPVPEAGRPRGRDIRRVGKRRIIFIDLNLIRTAPYAAELFEALVPLVVRWFGLSTSLIGRDRELMELMALTAAPAC
jgi:hypothetical protein